MIWKKDKKKTTDDMTPREAERVLEYKKRVLRRWAIVVGLLALAAFGLLAMDLLDRVLKGAPGGGLEINYNKVEEKLAWLGSEIRDLDATISDALHLTSTDGVLVNNVTPGSPADRAGLARGDVIISMNGTQIADSFTMVLQKIHLWIPAFDRLNKLQGERSSPEVAFFESYRTVRS